MKEATGILYESHGVTMLRGHKPRVAVGEVEHHARLVCRAVFAVADGDVALFDGCKLGNGPLLTTAQVAERDHPLRLAKRLVFDIVPYI